MKHLPSVYFRPEGTPIPDLKPGEAVITKVETFKNHTEVTATYIPYGVVDYIKLTLEVADVESRSKPSH